jgi:tryptophan halogenase
MDERIRKIVIAGGGTAGWLSAAYLNRALGDTVEITLVESSDVDPVGVGEATIPSLTYTMEFLGFRDHEWMPEVQATYKAAIKFANWSPSVRPYFWHAFSPRPEPLATPFERPYFLEIGLGYSMMHYALEQRRRGNDEQLGGMVLPTNALCEAQKCPIHPTDPSMSVRTAYHLDAGLLSRFLRKVATSRGVKQRVAHIGEVERDERGHIRALKMRDGSRTEGDLFIDCTGFHAVLLNGALEEPFINDNKYLLCDSAVAIQCESNPERDGINPYTISTALNHGWVWDVPLFHRNGTGYVYSSAFTNRDAAETELRSFLGPRSENGKANHIKMRVGRSRNLWVNNCVAIGLSGCFLEPLESTGIFLIEYGLANLLTLFPNKSFAPAFTKKYNDIMRTMYEETRDFIVLHYCINKRNDHELWRAVREPDTIPDSLKEKLEFFKEALPVIDPSGFVMFKTLSYASILDGNGALPAGRGYPILEHVGYDAGFDKLKMVEKQTARALASMPSHLEYLKRMYGGEVERPSASAMMMPAVQA